MGSLHKNENTRGEAGKYNVGRLDKKENNRSLGKTLIFIYSFIYNVHYHFSFSRIHKKGEGRGGETIIRYSRGLKSLPIR